MQVCGNRLQSPCGPPVKVAASAARTLIQGNKLYHCAGGELLDLSLRAVVRDNEVTPPPSASASASVHQDKGGASSSSR